MTIAENPPSKPPEPASGNGEFAVDEVTKDSLELVRVFRLIKSEDDRQRVIALAKKLASKKPN